MNEVAVTLERLSFTYQPRHWVLRDVDATIARGSVFAILGPNGRGKSTLLHLLIGALKPAGGRIIVQGKIAFVPQLFQVSFDYSLLEMVLMGRSRRIGLFGRPSRVDVEIALAALDRFGLADAAHRPFHELSGGQRQLTVFARALVAEADILVLGEPTSALDLKNQGLVLDWIGALRRDALTIVMTTHHPHHALAVADDAMLMLRGSACVCGAVADLLTEERLGELYEVPMRRLAFAHGGKTITTLVPIFGARADPPC